MKEKIEKGDIVKVHFHGAQITLTHRATVLNVPCATGDSWIFKSESGQLYYVSEGCTIELIVKYNRVNDALAAL